MAMSGPSPSKNKTSRNIFSQILQTCDPQSESESDGEEDQSIESEDYESSDEEWAMQPEEVIDQEDSSSDEQESIEKTDEQIDQDLPATPEESLYAAKDGTQWSAKELPSRKAPLYNIFRGERRVLITNVDTPTETFELFFTDTMIETIVEHTNSEGKRVWGDKKGGWKNTDCTEIKALLAALLSMGSLNQGMLDLKIIFNEIWGNVFVRSLFSRQRFETLMSSLRFDNKDSRTERRSKDPLAPIRDVWDMFEKQLKKVYSPGPFLTIDEQLVPFRGRCKFRMYMPSKPDKYGLKIFWLCEAETGYPLRGLPYTGKVGRLPEKDHAYNVVVTLAEPYFRTGRNITFDNFFTTKHLADNLLKNGLTCVGTVKKNKRFIPLALQQERLKKKNLYTSEFAFMQKASLVTYKSKKNKSVTILSTMHSDKKISDDEKQKPDVVLFYNSTKGGVDVMDQMVHKFSSKRKSKRWPVVYFTNILDLACLAATVIFRQTKPNDPLSDQDARSDFIRAVASGLAEGQLCRRVTIPNLSNFLRETIFLSLDVLGASKMPKKRPAARVSMTSTTPPPKSKKPKQQTPGSGKKKQQRCSLCHWKKDKKVSSKCEKCDSFVCPEHKRLVCSQCIPV